VEPIEKESFKFFLISLNYILNIKYSFHSSSFSTIGHLIPYTEQDVVHYAPYARVNALLYAYFEQSISNDDFYDLKQAVSVPG